MASQVTASPDRFTTPGWGTLHTVAEMLNWANEWGKAAKPRTTSRPQ